MNRKKFQYSLNAKAFLIGAVIIVLLLNAILVSLDNKISLEIDFTEDGIYNLTPESEAIVDRITEDTEILLLTNGTEDEEVSMIQNILSKYGQRNAKISARTVNIDKNPADVQSYLEEISGMPYKSMIIKQKDGDYQLVNAQDFFSDFGFSYIERRVTTKLEKLIDGAESLDVFLTTGHGEQVSPHAARVFESAGYTVSQFDTLTRDFPQTGKSIVVISSPKTDFAPEEIDKLDAYLDLGGNVQIYFDPIYGGENLTNLENYLAADWGILRANNVVLDAENMIENSYMIAAFSEHEITSPVAESQKRAGYGPANSFTLAAEKPENVTFMPLLSSTDKSYAKADVKTLTESGVMHRTEADEPGPHSVLVAATRENNSLSGESFEGKLVLGGSVLIFDELTSDPRFANEDILLNTVSWMRGTDGGMNIPAKVIPGGYMSLSNRQVWVWFAILVVIAPLGILIAGIVVFVKRRYK